MHRTTLVLTTVAIVAAAFGIACVVLVGLRRRIRTIDLVLSILPAAVLIGAGFAVLANRLNYFGIIHLVYLAATVTVPTISAAGCVAAILKRATKPAAALAALGVVPAALGWYATHIEPYRLRVDHHTVAIASERAGDDTIRVGVLADLQTNNPSDYETGAVDRLMALEPDVILLPGDLFQGTDAEFDRHLDDLRAVLRRLDAPHGVFFVRGDVDPGDRADRALEGSNVVLVNNETRDVRIGDRRIAIAGTELYFHMPAAVEATEALQREPPDVITLLVAHRPDVALRLPPSSRIDLVVAGHTHGGQVVVPGFGPVITMSKVPRDVARGGLHEIDGNAVYVSPGVGVERSQGPQVRFLSRPAIALLELKG